MFDLFMGFMSVAGWICAHIYLNRSIALRKLCNTYAKAVNSQSITISQLERQRSDLIIMLGARGVDISSLEELILPDQQQMN